VGLRLGWPVYDHELVEKIARETGWLCPVERRATQTGRLDASLEGVAAHSSASNRHAGGRPVVSSFHAQAFAQQTDPPPSWDDGVPKKAILEFVRVTRARKARSMCRPNSESRPLTRTARSGSNIRCTPRLWASTVLFQMTFIPQLPAWDKDRQVSSIVVIFADRRPAEALWFSEDS
jgi:hypothetical protein